MVNVGSFALLLSLSKELDGGSRGGASRGTVGGRKAPPSVPNQTGQFLLIIEPSTDNKI